MPENKRVDSPPLVGEGNIRVLSTAPKWVRGRSGCVMFAPMRARVGFPARGRWEKLTILREAAQARQQRTAQRPVREILLPPPESGT